MKSAAMRSWKTTVAGLGAILVALGSVLTQLAEGGMASVDWAVVIPAVIAGIGLLLARDSDKTSEDVGAK